MLSSDRCKTCGGDVEIDKTEGIGVCQYCGARQPLSAEDKNILTIELKAEAMQKRAELSSKNRPKVLILVFSLIAVFITLAVAGFVIRGNTISISNVRMTTALDSNNNPVDQVVSFSPDAAKIIMTATVENPTEDTTIIVVWKCEGNAFYTSNKIQVSPEHNNIYAYITPPENKQWTKGQYTVEIYVNDKEKYNNWTYFTIL